VDGLLAGAAQSRAVLAVRRQQHQGSRPGRPGPRLDEQPAAGRLDSARERPVPRLHHRHAVGQRLQHVQPLRLSIGRRHRQDIKRLQEPHLVLVRGRLNVLELPGQAGRRELLLQAVEVPPVILAQPPDARKRLIGAPASCETAGNTTSRSTRPSWQLLRRAARPACHVVLPGLTSRPRRRTAGRASGPSPSATSRARRRGCTTSSRVPAVSQDAGRAD